MKHSFKCSITRPLARRDQCGVLLIEVLVSILIFSFGILGTVALLARATQFSVNAEDRNRAALLANEITAVMWNRRTVNITSLADYADWQARVSAAAATGLPDGEGTVAVDGNNVATVTVTWLPTFARNTSDAERNRYSTQVVVP